MCRRLFWVVWMIIASFVAQAQDEFNIPDYNEIERLTKDQGSIFYYDNLFARYQANDTTLSPRDYRMLYYGYFFQPGYSPFKFTNESDTIKTIVNREQLTKTDWNELKRVAQGHLKQNPFDLKGINIAWLATRQTGDSAEARLYFDKLKKLVQTILSTGDGLSENTAFHVLSVSHEYDIVNILGYEFNGGRPEPY